MTPLKFVFSGSCLVWSVKLYKFPLVSCCGYALRQTRQIERVPFDCMKLEGSIGLRIPAKAEDSSAGL